MNRPVGERDIEDLKEGKLVIGRENRSKKFTPFEDFLKEKFAEDYIGTDDDMPDSFNNWLEEQDINDVIEYGDEFGRLLEARSMKEQSLHEKERMDY